VKRLGVIVAVLLRTAARGLQTSPLPSALASATIAIALTLVGAFTLVLGNMDGLVERFSEELHVVVYLDSELAEAAQVELRERVAALSGVESVALISREQALERLRSTLGGGELIAGLDHNPLPPSLEVELLPEARTERGVADVVAILQGLEGVDELAHGHEWIEGYARFAALARTVGVVLGVVLAGAALLIVANTIRLAVYAREDEIEILSLVGAGRVFQRGPFILEGLAEGTAGGLAALGVLYLAFQALLPQLEFGLSLVVGGSAPEFFAAGQALGLVATGALLGGAGSGFALIGFRR
jgi:cell division transport system permease protein